MTHIGGPKGRKGRALCVFFSLGRVRSSFLPSFFLGSQLLAFFSLSEPLVNGFWELVDPDSVFGGRIFETSGEGLNETQILPFSHIGSGARGGIQAALCRKRAHSGEKWLPPTSCLGVLAPGGPGLLGAHCSSWTSTRGVYCSPLLSRLREEQSGDD